MANGQTNLAEKALLIRLITGGWRPSVVDEEVQERVRAENNAAEGHGRYTKFLLTSDAFKWVNAVRRKMRWAHVLATLPWQDTWRLIPVHEYDAYKKRFARFEAEMIKARNDFRNQYEHWKEEARHRLGDLYDESEYPTADEASQRFWLRYEVGTVPDVNHFIADVSDEERAEIIRSVTEQNERRIKAAIEDLYQRVGNLLESARASLDKEKFSTALWEKVRDIIDVIPRLNITGEGELAGAVARLREAFAGVAAEELRAGAKKHFNPEKKAVVSEAVDELRAKMAGYYVVPEESTS